MASMREICRLCMCRDTSMLPIFDEDNLAAKITWISQLKVFEGDPLPAQICKQCSLRLNASYYFKEQCIAIDKTLREMVQHQCSTSLPEDRSVLTTSAPTRLTDRVQVKHDNDKPGYLGQVETPSTRRSQYSHKNKLNEYEYNSSAHTFDVKSEGTNITSGSHGNSQSYEACGQRMPQSSSVPETRLFSCPVCNKRFQSKANVKRHAVCHSKLQNRNQQKHFNSSANNTRNHKGGLIIPVSYSSTGSHEITIKEEPLGCTARNASPVNVCMANTPDSEPKISDVGDGLFSNHVSTDPARSFSRNMTNATRRKDSMDPSSCTQGFLGGVQHSMVSFPPSVKSSSSCSGRDVSVTQSAEGKHQTSPKSDPTKIQQTRKLRNKRAKFIFECPFCAKKYSTKSEVELHVMSHLQSETDNGPPLQLDEFEPILLKPVPVKSDPFNCSVCAKGFKKRSHLSYHAYVHTREKLHPCHRCFKTFRNETTVFQHHSKAHGLKKPFTCPLCDASFLHCNFLKLHLKITHNEHPFCCAICKQSFPEISPYREHLRTHFYTTPNENPK